MRKNPSLRTGVAAAVAFVSLALPAFSAHAALPAPMNWSGLYIGAHLGGTRAYFINHPVLLSPTGRGGSVMGGGQLGYNFQSGPHVFGVEGDGSWLGITAESPAASFDEDWQATFRGRYGYAFDRFLPYITAGVNITGTTASIAGVGSDSKTTVGYAAGAGVDISLCDRVSGRVEYLLTSVPETNYLVGGTAMSGESDNETLRVGLNYSLGNLLK